jgi:hypothetical protein
MRSATMRGQSSLGTLACCTLMALSACTAASLNPISFVPGAPSETREMRQAIADQYAMLTLTACLSSDAYGDKNIPEDISKYCEKSTHGSRMKSVPSRCIRPYDPWGRSYCS